MRRKKGMSDETNLTDINDSEMKVTEGTIETDENEIDGAKNKRRSSGIFWKMMLFVAMGTFLFSAYQLYSIFAEYKEGTDQYVDISDMVVERPSVAPTIVEKNEVVGNEEDNKENSEGDSEEDSPEGSEGDGESTGEAETPSEPAQYLPPEVNFKKLQGINSDVIGWIEVEAIPSISYPIVQANDNDYYLKRTIYKKKNSAGSIFVDARNENPFSDCNTIIYGHNMKNGSMFGLLKTLYTKEKYKESPYIWICTPNGKYRYEIFSIQYAGINSDTYQFHQSHGKEFQEYLIKMASVSKVDFKTPQLSENDNIITLSTCTSDKSTRFVVQARWVGTY